MDFFKKMSGYQRLMASLLTLLVIVSIGYKQWEKANPKFAELRKEAVGAIVGDVFDEKLAPIKEELASVKVKVVQIEKNQPKIQESTDVRLMDFHLSLFSSPASANNEMTAWEVDNWGSQLVALKYVARNPEAMDYLSTMVVDEEVFKVFKKKAQKYR